MREAIASQGRRLEIPMRDIPARTAFFLMALLALPLAGCISHEIPLRADHTAVLSGQRTAGMSVADATRTTLISAAKLTVDHGGRYFFLERPSVPTQDFGVKPGSDVIVEVLMPGDRRMGHPGVWDAQKILTQGVPQSVLNAPRYPSPPTTPQQTPRCTAYGCVW